MCARIFACPQTPRSIIAVDRRAARPKRAGGVPARLDGTSAIEFDKGFINHD